MVIAGETGEPLALVLAADRCGHHHHRVARDGARDGKKPVLGSDLNACHDEEATLAGASSAAALGPPWKPEPGRRLPVARFPEPARYVEEDGGNGYGAYQSQCGVDHLACPSRRQYSIVPRLTASCAARLSCVTIPTVDCINSI